MTVTPPEVPVYGGCPWPVDPACFTDEWSAYPEEVRARAVALASSTLSRLTGYRVGNCAVTVRPYVSREACFVPYSGFAPSGPFIPGMNANGLWVNNCSPCRQPDPDEVVLPAPVGRVDAVKVDGVVIAPENYRVDGNLLVWMGEGSAPWPRSQDMSKPDTEVGTFSVTYLNAYPVDSLGAYAAGVLSMEYAKACNGNKCRLPAGVTNVVRQGVSFEVASGAFPGGLTGIREVDAFITLWNPGGLQRPTTVWSPDVHRPRIGGTA